MLETGSGDPSHLRALFGDVDLHTLCRLAALFAVDNRTLARSYVHARRNVAAANPELYEFAAQFDFVNPPQERRHCPNPSVRRPMR
jgi:hypothetical protein